MRRVQINLVYFCLFVFQGVRVGYAFKKDKDGLGYYLDVAQVGKEFIEARQEALLAANKRSSSSSSSSSSRGAAAPQQQRQQEEMDIDVDDIQVEERGVPDSVFGSLKKK